MPPPEFSALVRDFRLRFFNWSLIQAEAEVKSGAPFLRSFATGVVTVALEILDELSLERKVAFLRACVKHRMKPLIGDAAAVSPEDAAFWREYLARMNAPFRILGSTQIKKPLPCRDLRKRIEEELQPVLGGKWEAWGTGGWRVTFGAGEWLIRTNIDLGGKLYDLSYDHSIGRVDHFYLMEGISPLRWLGVSGQTSWASVNGGNWEQVLSAMRRACAQFQTALPDLVEYT